MGFIDTIKTIKTIKDQDWDALVISTYGRPYCFQQQEGCRNKGSYYWITVPEPYLDDYEDEDTPDSVPEEVNHEEMCVKFSAWLARDPKQWLTSQERPSHVLQLWWERNFYPSVEVVAHDLHAKGLLEAGEYLILIED